MYVNEKLKLNKFQLVAIPSPRDVFSRFGGMLPKTGSYTGEDLAPMPMRKVDELGQMSEMDMYQMYKESRQREQAQEPAPDPAPQPTD